MAEAVSSLLEKVSHLLKWNGDFISGAESELQELKNELDSLKSLVEEAAMNPTNDVELLREMERQIKEVAYDAEDTFDRCLSKAAAAKGKNKPSFSRFLDKKKPTVWLAENVRSLRKDKVKPMLDKAKTYSANMQTAGGSGTRLEEEPLTRPRKAWQHQSVSLQDEKNKFIDYLMEQTDHLDVISIIGMPGVGKSTLASKIYENPRIQYKFRTRIWVYVSQEFNRREAFLSILEKFTEEDMSSLSDHELADMVRDYLEREEFLLVLDDLWTVDDWNAIQGFLPRTNTCGKVLITSRDWNVGRHASVIRGPYILRFLSEEESWELFQLAVFGNLDDCPQELERIGAYIAKQCDGLPLAIVVIGGILAGQFSRAEATSEVSINKWNMVADNMTMFSRVNGGEGLSEILAWIYNILPNNLRDCFLYLGVFPEDYEIPAWTLTRLWIAEGFIQPKEGKNLEETAEENLKDLINRNLVMVEKAYPNGEVKTCRVHDVIYSFCCSKAKEQNFFQQMKVSNHGIFHPPVSEIQKYRRVCIHSHLSKIRSEYLHGQGARSLLYFFAEPSDLDSEYISTISEAFNLLRVLEFNPIKSAKFPIKFTKDLIHLKYISLYCESLSVLPETISNLWNLQTLVINTMSSSFEIKANIMWKMYQLRHLKTKAAIILVKQQKGDASEKLQTLSRLSPHDCPEGDASENLQTLSRLSPKDCTEEVLNRAPNLRRLGIRGNLATLSDAKCLEKLDRLEKLKLVNEVDDGSTPTQSRGRLLRCFPQSLKRLTLSKANLDSDHMATLGKIDTLEILKLKDNTFMGETWNTINDGFHSLQFLLVANTNLVSWEASTDSFPCLTDLVIKYCRKLSNIPLHLAKSLKILDVEGVPESAAESARKIEEETYRARLGASFNLSIGPGCV